MAPNLTAVESAISVRNLSKKYRRFATTADTLKELLHPFGKKYHDEFWALKGVSFEVKKGETIGLIGRNGSGKSTLLQVLCGILQPTSGTVRVSGRVAALLELGAGFSPDFSGRENVYMNGALMGLSRQEMDDRFSLIAEFAEIGDFMEQPVKTYSSGMYVRLAFAVAINVDPDILIVDEALSVGDIKFQAKCFRKLEEFQNAGKTMIIVTHSMEQIVRHCTRAVLVDGGYVLAEGEPLTVSNIYMDLLFGKEPALKIGARKAEATVAVDSDATSRDAVENFLVSGDDRFSGRKSYNKNEYRWGDRTAEIIDYLVVSGAEADPLRCKTDEPLSIYLKTRFHREVKDPIIGLFIKTVDGIMVSSQNSRDSGEAVVGVKGKGDVVVYRFSFAPRLVGGEYLISVGVAEDVAGEIIPLDRRYDSIHLSFVSRGSSGGLVDLDMKIEELESKTVARKQTGI